MRINQKHTHTHSRQNVQPKSSSVEHTHTQTHTILLLCGMILLCCGKFCKAESKALRWYHTAVVSVAVAVHTIPARR